MGRQLPIVIDELPVHLIDHEWLTSDAALLSEGGSLPAHWKPKSAILKTMHPRKRRAFFIDDK